MSVPLAGDYKRPKLVAAEVTKRIFSPTFATGRGVQPQVLGSATSHLKGLHQKSTLAQSLIIWPLAEICGGGCGGNSQPNWKSNIF